jgi:peroxiredoxin
MSIHRLFAIAIVALTAVSASVPDPGYGIGESVADFTLKNFDGRMVSLSDYSHSKGVVLIFDCNTCPYSKAYNDRIIALHRTYAPKGFPVVTINSNDGEQSPGDSFEQMVARAKSKNYDFPYLHDKTQHVARAFGATNTPHVFLLRREGSNFLVSYIGAIDNNSRSGAKADKKYVEDALNALLKGNAVPVEKTKAVGCGIRWLE